MEIIIHQAILHVLDTTMDAPVLSGSGMEMTAEKIAYFQYHIEKLLASDDIRQCRPLPDSAFKNELEHNHDFVDLSCRIAGVLFDYMHAHTTIRYPPCRRRSSVCFTSSALFTVRMSRS